MKCIEIKLPDWNLKGTIKKLILMKNNYTLNLEDLPVKEAHKLDQKKINIFLKRKLINFFNYK